MANLTESVLFCLSTLNGSITKCVEILRILEGAMNGSRNQVLETFCQHVPAKYPVLTRDVMPGCSVSEETAFRYLFPILLILCAIGSALNLLIYRLPYFEDSTAVHLLRFKTVANIGFLLFLCPNMLYYWQDSERPIENIEKGYWLSRPYFLVFVGFFGALTAWSTLLITVETVVCITNPITFRLMNKSRYTIFSLLLFCLVGLLLQMTPAVAWTSNQTLKLSELSPAFTNETEYFCVKTYRNVLRPGIGFEIYERVYYWLHVLLVILIPITLMVLSSAFLVIRFQDKGLGEAFSERRRCVIRMTTVTTLSHLILEGPAVVTIYFGGVNGSRYEKYTGPCTLTLITNFMAAANAALPFYLYFICNANFRRMTNSVLSPCLGTTPHPVDVAGRVQRDRFKSCMPDDVLAVRAFNRDRLYSKTSVLLSQDRSRTNSCVCSPADILNKKPSFVNDNYRLVRVVQTMPGRKQRSQTLV